MPFDAEKMRSTATIRDLSEAYLNIAVTISPIVAALRKIEVKTGIDLSQEIKELEDMNASSFARFTGMTGWVDKA